MLAWIVLGLSVMITVAAWYISSDSVEREAEARFHFKVYDVRQAIEKRMGEQEAALWGGVGLFNASKDVTRSEWRDYVQALNLGKYLPGVQGYGYSEIVSPEQKAAHVQRVRAEGFPDYAIRPDGERESYTSIIYLEPFRDRNLRAFGYDMWSEPTRRTAMQRARDTGRPAMSGMVTLVQETGQDVQKGFLIYVPVYRRDMPVSTVDERREAIQGYVYSPFRIKDLMRGILGKEDTGIDFRIYDRGQRSAENLLYNSAFGESNPLLENVPMFRESVSLALGGHPWVLEFRSRPGFISAGEENQPVIIAAGGILIDILLFLTISSLTNQRRRAQSLANKMTRELLLAKEDAEAAASAELVLRTCAQESNEKLKAANDGLLKFTSIVAHDLRSPLKRIESFIKILQQEYADALDEEGQDILVRTERGSTRMRQMLDALHNYAKYSDTTITGKTASVATVVDHAIETLGRDIGDAVIEVDIDSDLRVRGDTILLAHVVQNLINNSLKFRGSERLVVEIRARLNDSGTAEISVTDNGIGIEPQFAEKVFEMFARLHNEDEYEGTGIGLAVCKKIIVDHGGDIRVDAWYREGARITFTLAGADDVAAAKVNAEAA